MNFSRTSYHDKDTSIKIANIFNFLIDWQLCVHLMIVKPKAKSY